MNKKVLIAYESMYGYVTQIAKFIKDTLVKNGLEPILVDVKRTRNLNVYPLEQYNGIIIGTGIDPSAFKKLRKTFLKKDLERFRGDKGPVAVFGNCPLNPSALYEPEESDEKYLQYICKKFHFIPDICKLFEPVFDFSPFSPLESNTMKSIKWVNRKKLKKMEIKTDYEGLNDFRDWKSIEEFADNFSALLVNTIQ